MTQLEQLQRVLYSIAKNNHEVAGYVKYNKILWSNIQGLDEEAIVDAMKELERNQ